MYNNGGESTAPHPYKTKEHEENQFIYHGASDHGAGSL